MKRDAITYVARESPGEGAGVFDPIIRPGERVRRGGGPVMVVTDVTEGDPPRAVCEHFDNDRLIRAVFGVWELTPVGRVSEWPAGWRVRA